jgi:hypothetical protein
MLTKNIIKTVLLKETAVKMYKDNSDGAKNVLVYRQDNRVEAFLPEALYCRR